jgi:hypothetical protein
MAVTVTVVNDGVDEFVADVEATADADATATIPHTMGAIPRDATLTWLSVAATLSLWRVTTRDATNIVLTKSTPMSSGAAGNQVRCYIRRPNTIGA